MRAVAAGTVVVAVLLALIALMWAGQRRLIYFPSGSVPHPRDAGLATAREVGFVTSDGLTLHG